MTADDAAFLPVDVAVLLALFGLVLIWAGWAAARGRLKRNYVIGMRTSAIMKSDETWRVAHKKCAWSLWSSGLVIIATSAVVTGVRPSRGWTLGLWIAMSVYLTAAVVIGFIQADKEARTVA